LSSGWRHHVELRTLTIPATATPHHPHARQIIRPGGFDSSYIRYSGLKAPVLIKGDRFNVSPQMGLTWADVETFSVDLLSELVGGDRTVSPAHAACWQGWWSVGH
jgi:hypothetical protein